MIQTIGAACSGDEKTIVSWITLSMKIKKSYGEKLENTTLGYCHSV